MDEKNVRKEFYRRGLVTQKMVLAKKKLTSGETKVT